ncbi:prepilin-type N-terminal cleavage/methylation domain-containing protein [Shewanella sp. 10N.7]|uniref:type II secretion system protein n=1 Tax=Shewanella sp. 10N.7 TaxID=2885093 RepID=UPI001E39B7A2|nr:prepilin-type N-terminal cleavage/methylation domain-containing protein [Shewanella sp. 10N.7]MCC4833822.1 prepilin-type N-terminal cleavage/methylation domain-containing protein [Shewanella sp. 10N.7]
MINDIYPSKLPSRNTGFTLIELVVVIIVLAILAVIAVSKFIDVKRDAEISRVQAIAASFEQSVTFSHTRWQLIGGSDPMNDLPGFANNDLDMNTFGYPLGTGKGNPMGNPVNIGPGQGGCVDLWNALIESPPSVAIRNTTDDVEFESYRHAADGGSGATQCTYVLRTLGDTAGRNRAEIKIVYDSIEGTVNAFIEDS